MSAIEDFDRQQAFAAGFAMAARDWGLSAPEYQAMCKRAADMTSPIPPPAAPDTPPPAPIVPITEGNADTAKVDAFVAEKKQQATGQAPQGNKLAAVLSKLSAEGPLNWYTPPPPPKQNLPGKPPSPAIRAALDRAPGSTRGSPSGSTRGSRLATLTRGLGGAGLAGTVGGLIEGAGAGADGTPPSPPPVDRSTPPADVLPPGASALDPQYAARVKAWEESQKPKVDPRKTSPGSILPGGTSRLANAMRMLLPSGW